MALSNLLGWSRKMETASAACFLLSFLLGIGGGGMICNYPRHKYLQYQNCRRYSLMPILYCLALGLAYPLLPGLLIAASALRSIFRTLQFQSAGFD